MPTALFSVLFATIGTLMYLAGCRVNRDVLKIRIYGQSLEDRFKNPHVLPLPKAAVDSLPWAISLRKFSPRRTSSGNPQYPIHCIAIITFCWASAFSFFGCSGGNISLIRFHSLSVSSYRFVPILMVYIIFSVCATFFSKQGLVYDSYLN